MLTGLGFGFFLLWAFMDFFMEQPSYAVEFEKHAQEEKVDDPVLNHGRGGHGG